MEKKIREALLEAAENTLGLPQTDMIESFDLDLFENELIDSIGVVALMNEVETIIGKRIDISRLLPDDFISLETMKQAILRII